MWTDYFLFLRLKKIQDKKKIARAKHEKDKAAYVPTGRPVEHASNILDEHDEDLLF